ncbi:hypothetical protein L861_14420 [Litchfieldella anticariensis FP35 = DSM 16096]|uniref:Glycine transporter domain-containing protein n=1 Tax=Litchfieldella anticariensis (strain DSM 16096 / CECT 5854 / CIP 108499 / LMG 22089 / FP35) TaxID=1121939 RepID=S2KE56_LITA3|nr:trimeric intracellular cation channel family protein [Halomonas anticariensis]EPC00462.1 hypothetical protein L861_14420 [Halomonas anticariensis FP35 = DSM 16096]
MTGWIYFLDLAGVVVFALSGITLACRSRMDPFGMLVLASVTAIGGGTLRDVLLGVRPVFWVSDPTYLWVIITTVVLAIVAFRHIHRISKRLLPVLDAFGLALFTVIGAHKALSLDYTSIVAVLMGLLTGVAGGMVRDVLARRVPMVLRQEIYATASMAGGIIFVVMTNLAIHPYIAIALAIFITLAIRLSAIYWHLTLPVFAWVSIPVDIPERADGIANRQDNAKIEFQPRRKVRVRMISSSQRRKR